MKFGAYSTFKTIINWRQAVPTAFTIAAMLAGFLSILSTIQGMVNEEPHMFSLAARLIMLAMILDGIDGNLARWLKGASEFGAELDTYVDMTAFGIAPAILIFAVTMQGRDPLWRMLLPSAVALSGVVRLARFKAKDPLRGQGGYAGLPITANAAWVALFVFITLTLQPHSALLNEGPVAAIFLTGILVFIILQVTNLRYPKPTKKAALFTPCVFLVGAFCFLKPQYARWVAYVLLTLGLSYVVVGPMFVKGLALRRARKEAREAQDNDPE